MARANGRTWLRLRVWARRIDLGRKLALSLALLAVASGIATYVSLTRSSPFGPDPRSVLVLLLADLMLLASLGAIVARRLVKLWVERRRGSAGSRLHTRTVAMFSVVAVAPAIIIAVFSALFFSLGLQAWFGDRVRNALSASATVAEAYLDEHRKVIRADILAMANDLNRDANVLLRNPQRFNNVVSAQADLRSLAEAIVFARSGRVVARSRLSFALEFGSVPQAALNEAAAGEVVLFTSDTDDRVRAIVRLNRFVDSFLYVGRFVDPRVISQVERNRRAVAAYEKLEGERSSIQITFALLFIVVTLLLLMVAVWLGLSFATRVVRPIGNLISAAEQVRAGNLDVQVEAANGDDELGNLARAFNRMTGQLSSQRSELIAANRQLDMRRQFTEAVLAGVSAGVIGLDADGRINLPNRSATTMLETDTETLTGQPLADAFPEIAHLLEEARERPDRLAEGEVKLTRGGRARTLFVRVVAERAGGAITDFVVTFDDITALVTAQRTAAWADVARRIAHEIKNPLTPIQLSAERLKRKYLKEITTEPEVFTQCTDTIIRQTADIGRMVDEFSAFARMPAPVFERENLAELLERAQFMQRLAHPDLLHDLSTPPDPVMFRCDARQMSQVLINLYENAAEAIVGRDGDSAASRGRIDVEVKMNDGRIVVEFADNGCGLPGGLHDRLTEPYVTTRDRGTGLGLAIVKKIVDDHGGAIELRDRPGGGAVVQLAFATEAVVGGDPGPFETSPAEEGMSHGS